MGKLEQLAEGIAAWSRAFAEATRGVLEAMAHWARTWVRAIVEAVSQVYRALEGAVVEATIETVSAIVAVRQLVLILLMPSLLTWSAVHWQWRLLWVLPILSWLVIVLALANIRHHFRSEPRRSILSSHVKEFLSSATRLGLRAFFVSVTIFLGWRTASAWLSHVDRRRHDRNPMVQAGSDTGSDARTTQKSTQSINVPPRIPIDSGAATQQGQPALAPVPPARFEQPPSVPATLPQAPKRIGGPGSGADGTRVVEDLHTNRQMIDERAARLSGPPSTLQQLGVAAFGEKEYVAAAAAFQAQVSQNPWSHDALYNLANSYYALKDFARLIETANKFLALHPMSEDALRLLAQGQRGLGLDEDVLRTAQRLVQLPFILNVLTFRISRDSAVFSGVAVGRRPTDSNLNPVRPMSMNLGFTFLDSMGRVVDTKVILVPALGEGQRFQVSVTGHGAGVRAWRYVANNH
jgi:hypothetical protein